MKSAEAAAHEIDTLRDRLNAQVAALDARASDMFAFRNTVSFSLQVAALCLVGSCTMYGETLLRSGEVEQSVNEFLSDVLRAFGQKRGSLMNGCARLDRR